MNTDNYTIKYTIHGVEHIQKRTNDNVKTPCKKKGKYPAFDSKQYRKKETGIFYGKNKTAIRILFSIAIVLVIVAFTLLIVQIVLGFLSVK